MANNGASVTKIGPATVPAVTPEVTPKVKVKRKTTALKPPRKAAKATTPVVVTPEIPAAAPTPALAKVKTARIGMAAVALIALGVSLTHLSKGVISIADTSEVEGWAMAIVFDLFLVADEYLMLTCEFTDRTGKMAAETLLGLVVVWSMYLNAAAFSHNHFDLEHSVQLGWGVTLPLAILLAVYAAARSK
jgi:hypothetical protein